MNCWIKYQSSLLSGAHSFHARWNGKTVIDIWSVTGMATGDVVCYVEYHYKSRGPTGRKIITRIKDVSPHQSHDPINLNPITPFEHEPLTETLILTHQ